MAVGRSAAVAALALVLVAGCPKHDVGGECDDSSDCMGELRCVSGRCAIDSKLHEKMAKQSGVVVTGERMATATNAGGAVRVRSARAKTIAFAVCAADERLIGGWCSPTSDGSGDSTDVTEHEIVGHTKDDTIGAQWKCTLSGERITAFAMCQKVAAFRPEPPPVPESGVDKPAAPDPKFDRRKPAAP